MVQPHRQRFAELGRAAAEDQTGALNGLIASEEVIEDGLELRLGHRLVRDPQDGHFVPRQGDGFHPLVTQRGT